MKILYAIQGTGNGHISRAQDIIPELQRYGTVDILVSGSQVDIPLPYPITYRCHGISFVFGRHGGVALWSTLKQLRMITFLRDIIRLPIHQYDMVISDFEPISTWSGKLRGKRVIGMSHQAAVLHPQAARPLMQGFNAWLGRIILRHYAPTSSSYGFYFHGIAPNVFPAIIREQVRHIPSSIGHHYTVYLPSYSDDFVIRMLRQIDTVSWQVFSKHTLADFVMGNVHIRKINNEAFVHSLANSRGVLMGAGFEGPCEALYLGKSLMVIPMKGQYEQQCNAAGLAMLGVPVIPALAQNYIPDIQEWCTKEDNTIQISFPEETARDVVDRLMNDCVEKRKSYSL